jgi:succinate dehydrogenase/fumarate reductase flavoprotein subunit
MHSMNGSPVTGSSARGSSLTVGVVIARQASHRSTGATTPFVTPLCAIVHTRAVGGLPAAAIADCSSRPLLGPTARRSPRRRHRSTTTRATADPSRSLPIEQPPFTAFPITCGITFTFGGVRVDEDARVLDVAGRPLPGLFAAGELVGGLVFHNYPGGTGLTAGAVYGRRAGYAAAARG